MQQFIEINTKYQQLLTIKRIRKMKEYIDVLKKWKDFDGRARRREYWMFVLFMAIFAIVAGIIDGILGTVCVFVGLYYLAMFLPMIAVSVRRMHDIGKSGWWLFITFVPVIGSLWYLFLTIQDGQPGSNQYGENPKGV